MWVTNRKYSNVRGLYVPEEGIVAEITGGSWEIFVHGYEVKGDGDTLSCERRLAEEKLYGFRLENLQ